MNPISLKTSKSIYIAYRILAFRRGLFNQLQIQKKRKRFELKNIYYRERNVEHTDSSDGPIDLLLISIRESATTLDPDPLPYVCILRNWFISRSTRAEKKKKRNYSRPNQITNCFLIKFGGSETAIHSRPLRDCARRFPSLLERTGKSPTMRHT